MKVKRPRRLTRAVRAGNHSGAARQLVRAIGQGAVAVCILLVLAALAGTARATTAYSVVDLGALDSPMPLSWSYGLSESGQVIGQSNGATQGSSPGFSWTESGGMVALGPLGGLYSVPTAMNEGGQVVGHSSTATAGVQHAFSWTSTGGIVDLGTLGGTNSWALDVNNDGVVVGWSEVAGGSQHAFVWKQGAGMLDLGTLGGSFSTASAINDSGQVVGGASTASGAGHPFLWTQADGMTDLGTLGGTNGSATLIDANGHVAGVSQATDGNTHAFWWTPSGGMRDAGTLGGSFVQVAAMNEHDQIVGSGPTSGGQTHAFLWSPTGGMVDLGTLGGVGSEATDVNNSGQVVGMITMSNSFPPSKHLFLWTSEGMVDLGALPFIGPNYQPGINDTGQISSTALVSGGIHAVLLEPADTTPPDLAVAVAPNVLWPPNHQYGTVKATVTAADDSGTSPTIQLVSVISNEPDNGVNDGNTVNDIVIKPASAHSYPDTFQLRAERDGLGKGRTYTITYRASDASNNSTTQSATVTVPIAP